MEQMIRERADWCISRQRHWGLPIPVFYCEDCGKPVCTDETINKISEIFAEKGSNAWFDLDVSELMPDGFVCPHCGGKHFTKEQNTLDGWFDSGSSHYAAPDLYREVGEASDVYLEGADQYRGWFQSSLLTAVGALGGGAPFKTVLTHGWVVDGEGKAMHKSLGNSVAPEEMISKYGADIVRLWVASSDYRVDVRVSDNIFKQLSETYRKIRNTSRIILANLNDFNPDTDMVDMQSLYEIDKWAVSRLNDLAATVRKAYDTYEFHLLYHSVNNFCTNDLSKLYIDITKDRVYVEKKDSLARRSAQTALYTILSGMTRLIAPMLSFTAEEIWQAMPHKASDICESVFLNIMPEYEEALAFGGVAEPWNKLFILRDDVMKALELARASKLIGKSLDAKVTIFTEDKEQLALLNSFAGELATVFIVSGAKAVEGKATEGAFTETESGIAVLVEKADGHKCDRCWSYSEAGELTEEGFICERCKNILNS